MAVCVFVWRGRPSAREVSDCFLSSTSPPPPPPVPVWDWLVTLLNNSNWLASAVGGSQTANHCGSPRRALPFFFSFFSSCGQRGLSIAFWKKSSKVQPTFKKTKQKRIYVIVQCRSNSCLLFSLSVKTGKEALNSFHNPSTPFFFFFGFQQHSLSSLPLALFPGHCCLMGFVLIHYTMSALLMHSGMWMHTHIYWRTH